MSTLLLRLAAPMQSWGSSSRFSTRATDHAPTKSGVIGLLAAARGLRRTDPLEDLLELRFGVRIDQPGSVERDFQTARPLVGKPLPLTNRYYLSDAVFVAAVQGDASLIAALDHAIRHPEFPLYLGRRAFPPAEAILPPELGVRDTDIWAALHDLEATPWQAREWYRDWYRRRFGASPKALEMRLDADAVPDSVSAAARITFAVMDEPISFDPRLRQYGVRSVVETWIPLPPSEPRAPKSIDHPEPSGGGPTDHDPMTLLGAA